MACGRPSATCMAQVVLGNSGWAMPGRLVGEVSVGIDLSVAPGTYAILKRYLKVFARVGDVLEAAIPE